MKLLPNRTLLPPDEEGERQDEGHTQQTRSDVVLLVQKGFGLNLFGELKRGFHFEFLIMTLLYRPAAVLQDFRLLLAQLHHFGSALLFAP